MNCPRKMCQICHKIFKDPAHLKAHQITHTSINQITKKIAPEANELETSKNPEHKSLKKHSKNYLFPTSSQKTQTSRFSQMTIEPQAPQAENPLESAEISP